MNAVKIIEDKYPSGNPRWQVQAFVGGERIRHYFTDENAAIADKNRIERSSAEAIQIPEKFLHEAWACYNDLQKHGWTLRRATDYLLEKVIKFQEQPTVQDLINEYLAEQKGCVAGSTLIDLRHRLHKFALHFGTRKAHEITSDEIKKWHSHDLIEIQELDPQSRVHCLNKASQFFLWCVRNKKCLENPLASVKRPKVIRKSIKYYLPSACQIMLNTVPDRFYFYTVLGLICGIRPDELKRLRSHHFRTDGDGMIIRLDSDVTKKTRRRVIELWPGDTLGDMALAWLQRKPIPERIFDGNDSTFKKHFRRWRKILSDHGVEWLKDGLRHTAASMHYAQYRDITKTAGLLGDQVRIVQEHYTGLAIQSEAKEFYALRPADSHGDSTAIDNGLSAAEKTL